MTIRLMCAAGLLGGLVVSWVTTIVALSRRPVYVAPPCGGEHDQLAYATGERPGDFDAWEREQQ